MCLVIQTCRSQRGLGTARATPTYLGARRQTDPVHAQVLAILRGIDLVSEQCNSSWAAPHLEQLQAIAKAPMQSLYTHPASVGLFWKVPQAPRSTLFS